MSIDYDGTIVNYTKKDFNKIKHGYIISIHKSQGSEFELVIMPIPVLVAQHLLIIGLVYHLGVGPGAMMIMGVPAGNLTNSFGCKKLCNISALVGIAASLFLAAAVMMQNGVLLFTGLLLLGATLGINEGPTIRRITIHCTEDTQGSAGSLSNFSGKFPFFCCWSFNSKMVVMIR